MNSLSRTYQTCANAPRLMTITEDNIPMLPRMLKYSGRADPFSRSAAYYAMTGRKGLWVYGDDHTAMLVANHPNSDGTLLLFPPNGDDPVHLVNQALANPFSLPPADRWELARVGPDDRKFISALSECDVTQPHEEDILDWTYPVHAVNPQTIMKRSGKEFVSFRGHVNRAFREEYRSQPVNIAEHKGDLVGIINQWADSRNNDKFSREDLTGPTNTVLRLMEQGALDIQGTISRDSSGRPIGFWLWERVDDTAMSLVRAYLKRPGNAEFGILSMAEQLHGAGLSQMYTGGSETANLDKFKRKMQPENSIELKTLTLHPHHIEAFPKNCLFAPFSIRL